MHHFLLWLISLADQRKRPPFQKNSVVEGKEADQLHPATRKEMHFESWEQWQCSGGPGKTTRSASLNEAKIYQSALREARPSWNRWSGHEMSTNRFALKAGDSTLPLAIIFQRCSKPHFFRWKNSFALWNTSTHLLSLHLCFSLPILNRRLNKVKGSAVLRYDTPEQVRQAKPKGHKSCLITGFWRIRFVKLSLVVKGKETWFPTTYDMFFFS